MIWAADKNGIAETTALYGATFAPLDAAGSGSLEIDMLNQKWATPAGNPGTNQMIGAANTSMQSACLTSVTQYEKVPTTNYNGDGTFATGGFAGSSMGCLDYVVDEINVSGVHTIYAFSAATLTLEASNQSVLDTAATTPPDGATATGAPLPASSTVGTIASTDNYLYGAAPIDNPPLNAIYAWNFGVLKQIEAVVGDTGNSIELAALVLFSCPE